MNNQTRKEQFSALYPAEPAFRWTQIEQAFFNPKFSGWNDILNLPNNMRQTLADNIPWLACQSVDLQTDKAGGTFKAALKLADGEKIETVLMANARGQFSVCVSTQVGCAMNCAFCATGKMGLKRNLTVDEIVDQLRFWRYYLKENKSDDERISNLVLMGMGEPLSNYDNVKTALNTWLKFTDIGPTHITVSTVGLLPNLEFLLTDKDWPPVRLAISLHSANETLRGQIMPSTAPDFLIKLSDWCKRYLNKQGNRRHHLTFEYILLQDVNDSLKDAKLLADYVTKIGRVKVNLIPYNKTGAELERSSNDKAEKFLAVLENSGVTATIRKSLGEDIAAACGQLINQ